MIVGELDNIMIVMGKQRVLDNYVSVPYLSVNILVNNCFPIPIIVQQSNYIDGWPWPWPWGCARPDNIYYLRNI